MATHELETSKCALTVTPNTSKIKFNVLEMSIGSSAGYGLELEDNGIPVDSSELKFIVVNNNVKVSPEGQLSALNSGEDIVFTIYKGKRYGHYVNVAGDMAMTFDVDPKPVKKTRAKKTK